MVVSKLAPRLRALRVASPTPRRGQHRRPGGARSAVFPDLHCARGGVCGILETERAHE